MGAHFSGENKESVPDLNIHQKKQTKNQMNEKHKKKDPSFVPPQNTQSLFLLNSKQLLSIFLGHWRGIWMKEHNYNLIKIGK